MKNQIYKKLHQACINAGGVKKADKVKGMHFNPLLHDAVQEVATQALLDVGLYPTCSYKIELQDNSVFAICTMKVHDVDSPEDFITIDGCAAMGARDSFGTGKAMSYSRKYAFLNLLNLKTGIKDEDGYERKQDSNGRDEFDFDFEPNSTAKAAGSVLKNNTVNTTRRQHNG